MNEGGLNSSGLFKMHIQIFIAFINERKLLENTLLSNNVSADFQVLIKDMKAN